MRSNVVVRVFLRPSRSPKCPKTAPPTGRAKNATANVEKAATVPAVSPRPGKNSVGKTSAAAVP
jgi:hypothetical protein